jgi:hypothetical protein
MGAKDLSELATIMTNAFTAALGIKVYGSNSALKRIVERTETQKPKKNKNKEEK